MTLAFSLFTATMVTVGLVLQVVLARHYRSRIDALERRVGELEVAKYEAWLRGSHRGGQA